LLILILDSIFQFVNGSNFLGYEIISGRVSSFFKEELVLGSFLIRLLPIFFWFIYFFKFDLKKNEYYLVIFLSLYFISIYISAGRTSFFLCIVSIILFFLIIKNIRRILSFSILTLLIFILCTSYFKLGASDPGHRMFIKTFKQMDISNVKEDKSENINNIFSKKFKIYSEDHEGHIKLALKLFSENKIFGVGPKGFRYYCRGVNFDPDVGICSTHPHNILIQIISELGLIGLLFYIVAAIYVLYNFFRSIFNKNFTSEFLAFYSVTIGLIVNLFPLIPGGNFFNNWISMILYYNIGLYLYSCKKCLKK
jgi:O-antigen ligase